MPVRWCLAQKKQACTLTWIPLSRRGQPSSTGVGEGKAWLRCCWHSHFIVHMLIPVYWCMDESGTPWRDIERATFLTSVEMSWPIDERGQKEGGSQGGCCNINVATVKIIPKQDNHFITPIFTRYLPHSNTRKFNSWLNYKPCSWNLKVLCMTSVGMGSGLMESAVGLTSNDSLLHGWIWLEQNILPWTAHLPDQTCWVHKPEHWNLEASGKPLHLPEIIPIDK